MKSKNAMFAKMLETFGVTRIQGWGVLKDAHTIEVDRTSYTGDHILIATGSKPCGACCEGHEHCLNSDDFFNLDECPKRVIVIGGGYIGTELG